MNKLKKILLAVIVGLMLPVTTLLTACGATPSSEITGIAFNAKKYDDDGTAIFEVDKGVTTELDYKIFPSSASGYKVYFDPIDKGTAENASRFTFKDGQITVDRDGFEDVRYKIRVGEYSDECIIRVKEYPVEIWTEETEVTLNTDKIKAISVKARYKTSAGNYVTRNITEKDYDFLVESSDETIIDVPNENRLKFLPIRNRKATGVVTVTLLNSQGEKTGLTFKIKVNVIPTISEAYVIMSGASKKIYNNESEPVEINYSSEKLQAVDGGKLLTFKIFAINTNNILYEGEINYSLNLSKKTLVSVSDDGKGVVVSDEIQNGDTFLLTITVLENFNMEDNTTFVFNINIKIVKS